MGTRLLLTNFDSAKTHGFIRGAYHFYNPKRHPISLGPISLLIP